MIVNRHSKMVTDGNKIIKKRYVTIHIRIESNKSLSKSAFVYVFFVCNSGLKGCVPRFTGNFFPIHLCVVYITLIALFNDGLKYVPDVCNGIRPKRRNFVYQSAELPGFDEAVESIVGIDADLCKCTGHENEGNKKDRKKFFHSSAIQKDASNLFFHRETLLNLEKAFQTDSSERSVSAPPFPKYYRIAQ